MHNKYNLQNKSKVYKTIPFLLAALFSQTIYAEEEILPEVKVQSKKLKESKLPETYAGGQVARGASIGVLGNQDMMDVPFSFTSYAAETIENQQARTIADILQNDASVRSGQAFGMS